MAFVAGADPLLRVAVITGFAVFLLALAMILQMLLLRLRLSLRQRREVRFTQRWQLLLTECAATVPLKLPQVAPADWFTLLSLWNHHQESSPGVARQRLVTLALQLRMDLAARELLDRGNVRVRLMAVLTLGHLGDRESWDRIYDLAQSPHPLLSLASARALMLVDAAAALSVLLPSFTERTDWPLARIVAMLEEAGADSVSRQLADAVNFTPAGGMPRLIALMDAARTDVAMPAIRGLLETSEHEDVLIACLKSRHVPPDRDLVARFAAHRSWRVRTQAARALAKAAQPGDEKLLTLLLADPVWWVRYRAAQSLAQLRFVSNDDLWRLRFLLEDKFAVNMLDQVMAERKLS